MYAYIETARRAGHQAFMDGRSKNTNPYKHCEVDSALWSFGFSEAEKAVGRKQYELLCARGGRRRPGPPAWPAVLALLLAGAAIGATLLAMHADEVDSLPGCAVAGLVEVRTLEGTFCLRPEQMVGKAWQ